MANEVHLFETAGLGKAPFRFVGIETRVGPLNLGNGMTVGSPGQPMGTCDYCGQGIAECCIIVSADLKRFIVGNVCVYKTGDAGLRRVVEKAVREKAKAREVARVEAAVASLQDEAVRAALRALPHPKGWSDSTLLGWAEWMLQHAGHTGRLKVARAIEKALPTVNAAS